LLKDFEVLAKSGAVKAYSLYCLGEEDSFEDQVADYVQLSWLF